MKVMVISDIHGGLSELKQALDRFRLEKANRLLILGDFAGYFNSSADFEVAEVLNEISDKICAVRGNCDNEHLESMFHFGLMDIRSINLNSVIVTLTHGHLYDKYHLPDYCGDILLTGHTHYGIIDKQDDKIFANPGSISRPRNGSLKTYLTIDDKEVCLKTLDGNVIHSESLNKK